MVLSRREKFAAVCVLVALICSGLLAYRLVQAAKLANQLRGALTAKDAEFQAASAQLGLAQSTLTTPAALKAEDVQLIASGVVPDLRKFEAAHHATVEGITTAKAEDRVASVQGTATVTVTPAAVAPSNSPAAVCPAPARETVIYDWHDAFGRFHLRDTDALNPAPGHVTFSADQHFRLTAVLLHQTTGELQTEQVALQEVTTAGALIGDLTLTEVHFSYAPSPPTPLFDPHLIAQVVATILPRLPVKAMVGFGLGAMLVQYRGFGLQLAGYSDLNSLEGSGGAVGVYWRPSIAGREINAALDLAVAVNLLGQVAPQLGLDFVLW